MPGKKLKFSDTYDLREEIGKGAFSTVYRCIERSNNQQFAVKVIKKTQMDRRNLIKLESEARICGKLDHPNIVRLRAFVSEPKLHYLVFDLVTGGELFDDIVKLETYTEVLTADCMLQLLDVMNYIHGEGVVHRDLKPENILLESSQSKVIKLADFGLAIEVKEDELKWFGLAGTPYYMAPEVLEMKPYGRPVDMWACGVIMYILLVGYQPFYHQSEWRLHSMIKTGDYEMSSTSWSNVSDEAKDLVTKLLCVVPTRRFTATQALQHPWFAKVKTMEVVNRKDTIEKLKEFNARRKFIAAIRIVHMIKTLKPATDRQTKQSNIVCSSSSSSKSRSSSKK